MTKEEALKILRYELQTHIASEVELHIAMGMAIEALSADCWIPCSERLPEENVPVIITWTNHDPVAYYADIKDKPFVASGVYFAGHWYWYSSVVEDLLAEYGRTEWDKFDELMADEIEVLAWQPLPRAWGGAK